MTTEQKLKRFLKEWHRLGIKLAVLKQKVDRDVEDMMSDMELASRDVDLTDFEDINNMMLDQDEEAKTLIV